MTPKERALFNTMVSLLSILLLMVRGISFLRAYFSNDLNKAINAFENAREQYYSERIKAV